MSDSTVFTSVPLNVHARAGGVKKGLSVQPGSILIDLGAEPPESLLITSRSLPSGWGLIRDPACVVDDEMSDAGWNLFFLAGKIRIKVAGFDRAAVMQSALNRVIREVKTQKCNSFEIARVTESSFLGVSRVTVYGHVRHLQKGRLLLG